MNTQPISVSEHSVQAQGFAAAVVVAARPLYWSIRRELWENRFVYVAPFAAAAIFIFGFTVRVIRLRIHAEDLRLVTTHDMAKPYELAATLIMGIAILIGLIYSLDALYGERRDRSILFWKSLPVSDVTAVLAKLAIPILILPLLSFVITIATQLLMLVLSSAVLAGSGVNIAALWTEAGFVRVSVIWLYHLVTVHGLWYAPLYAWLLLVSAWSPRAPFLFAIVPPFVVWGLEKMVFSTSFFLNMLRYRLEGPSGGMTTEHQQDFTSTLIPHHFLSTPGLWTGLAVAAVFLFFTVRLRRSRGPI
jgi:ABC-2 type transport system permease protein